MSWIGNLDPRNLTNAQRVFAGVIVLGLLATVVFMALGGSAQANRWDGIELCSAEGSDAECLETREGSVVSRGTGDDRRYYFDPEGEDGRESLGKRRPSGGTVVDGLYEGDDLIGLVDSDGERHYQTSLFGAPAPYLIGSLAGLAVFMVGLFLFGRSLRKG